MPADHVIDASMLVKASFTEVGSDVVGPWVFTNVRLVAPAFIITEIASVACRKVKAGLYPPETALRLADKARELVQEVDELDRLRRRAIDVAVACGASFYDGLYVACALERAAPLVTADDKLVAKVRSGSLGVTCLTLADLGGT